MKSTPEPKSSLGAEVAKIKTRRALNPERDDPGSRVSAPLTATARFALVHHDQIASFASKASITSMLQRILTAPFRLAKKWRHKFSLFDFV